MPHATLCVSGYAMKISNINSWEFQCRTQHCVCRDTSCIAIGVFLSRFNAARSIVCVGTCWRRCHHFRLSCFNAARSIVCVGTGMIDIYHTLSLKFQCRRQHCVCRDLETFLPQEVRSFVSMPHAALCVSGLSISKILRKGEVCFNAARSIVCVGTGELK